MATRPKDETNVVRRLALYLRPGKYWQGVRYLGKMNMYYAAGDAESFLVYTLKYLRAVVRRTDDVAKSRALKTIDECYGGEYIARRVRPTLTREVSTI